MILALLLTIAPPQGFIDAPASTEAASEQQEDTQEEIVAVGNAKPWYQSLGLGGFLDAGFGAVWPEQQNTFFVGEVELDLHKKFFDVAALRIDLNLLNRLPWQPLGVGSAPNFTTFGLAFDNLVEQAHGEWMPLGDAGPRLRLGKYNALVGFERQDAPDRLMVSQSLVFLHGSPANFTGIALDIPLPASLKLTLHGAVNGWDRGLASSRNKTVGLQLAFDDNITKNLRLTVAASVLYGTERFANARDFRLGVFAYGVVQYARILWVAAEATYGQEPGVPTGSVPGLGDGTGSVGMSRWWGVSAWAKLRVPGAEWFSLAARYDYFSDPQRTRGLVQTAQDIADGGLSQRQQASLNLTTVIVEGVSARLEYNVDFLQGVQPDFVRQLAVAQRIVLQALLQF